MTLIDVAYSPYWILVCLMAWGLIYWDLTKPTTRRLVIAVVVAGLSSVALSAAEVTNYDICVDPCPRLTGALWWVYTCFIC